MRLARMTSVMTIGLMVAAIVLLASGAGADRGQIATGQAVLTSMYGDVQVRHGTGGYAAAKLNEVLKPNDGVKTGASSRAEISVGEGGYVRMDGDSQILITSLDSGGSSTFQALTGGLWVTLEKALGGAGTFEVRMPSAVASVKGTVFRCQVGEDGTSETYVYEGEVNVSAGDHSYQIRPDEHCRVPRHMQGVVDRFNLRGDDEAAWVMYNRHRDIIQHLGDPTVSVALREHEMPEEGAFATSAAIAGQLALHGLRSTSIADLSGEEFEFRPDGTINWLRQPESDYSVIGDVTLEQAREVDGGWSARVAADVRLVHDGDPQALTSISVRVPGEGASAGQAVGAALDQLGRRVGAGLAPRIIREMMQAQTGMVRVDISGGTRELVGQLRRAIVDSQGVLRTAPLVLPGNRISLAVISDLSADEIAAIIEASGGDQIEQIVAGHRVVFVRYPRMDAEYSGDHVLRDLDDRIDWIEEQFADRPTDGGPSWRLLRPSANR